MRRRTRRRLALVVLIGVAIWFHDAVLRGVGWVTTGGWVEQAGQWWPLAVGGVVGGVVYLWDVWRRPDVACWWCCGVGRVFRLTWGGRRVSGLCRLCRNERYHLRWVAKTLGWTRHSGVGW
jgi:hypothetical protein